MVQKAQQLLRDNKLVRWTALVLLASMMLFAYMFVDILSPVKSMLEQDLLWDSTTFGFYGGSEFFLNVFVGFLIIAGIILDKMGIRFTVLLSGALMVIGAAIKFYALTDAFAATEFAGWLNSWWTDIPASAKLASFGFMIFGSGTEMAGITVSKAIVKWFQGKELAMAMGVEMAIARVGVAFAALLAPRLYEWQLFPASKISQPVMFTLLLLCIGMICFIMYCFQDKKLDKQMGDYEMEPEEPFHFSDLGKIFSSLPFWIVALLCVTYYSAIFPFQKFAIDMLSNNLGMAEKDAGMIFFWFPLGAAAITPFLGNFKDKKGKGVSMLILGAVLLLCTHLVFAFLPWFGTGTLAVVVALVAIVILGISFSLVPASLWPSVPKIIDNSILGSAYALIFWIQNWGLMGYPMLIGKILDMTNKSPEEIQALKEAGEAVPPTDYTYAMLAFAALGIVAFLLAFLLLKLNKKNHWGLQLPENPEAK